MSRQQLDNCQLELHYASLWQYAFQNTFNREQQTYSLTKK